MWKFVGGQGTRFNYSWSVLIGLVRGAEEVPRSCWPPGRPLLGSGLSLLPEDVSAFVLSESLTLSPVALSWFQFLMKNWRGESPRSWRQNKPGRRLNIRDGELRGIEAFAGACACQTFLENSSSCGWILECDERMPFLVLARAYQSSVVISIVSRVQYLAEEYWALRPWWEIVLFFF